MAKRDRGPRHSSVDEKKVFVDTSGFFALLCTKDPAHGGAKRRMQAFAKSRRRMVTTDGVLVETFSLLKARGMRHLCTVFERMVSSSRSLQVEWTQPARFTQATAFFLKQIDQDYSFTDCVSFLVMKEHALVEALTTDHHFQIAGFRALL
jgi:predicted nucleic acid-binding protein